MLGDLKNPKLMYLKGALFLLGGVLSAGLILFEHPSLRITVLLLVAIWCFCRAYYFAFYVIEHYIDPQFRFAGLGAFLWYLVRGTKERI